MFFNRRGRMPAVIYKLFTGRRPAAVFVVTSIKRILDPQSCPKLDTDLLTRVRTEAIFSLVNLEICHIRVGWNHKLLYFPCYVN
jgi:hypothetical protein